MFNKKREPVLTATTCRKLARLRQALEVFTGRTIEFVHMDFNTGNGRIWCGDLGEDIQFGFPWRDDLVHFTLEGRRQVALFVDGVVKVAGELGNNSHKVQTVGGECTLRWVGRSMNDRWEEPLFLKGFQAIAERHGMTLQELISPKATF